MLKHKLEIPALSNSVRILMLLSLLLTSDTRILAEKPRENNTRNSVAMALAHSPEKNLQVDPFLLPNITFKTRELITEHLHEQVKGLLSMDLTIDTSKSPKKKTRELIPNPLYLGQMTIASSQATSIQEVLETPGLEITIDLKLPLFTIKPWPTCWTIPAMVRKSLDTFEEKGNLLAEDCEELETFFEDLKRDSRIKIRHNPDGTVTLELSNDEKTKKLTTETSKKLFLAMLKHSQAAFTEVLREQVKTGSEKIWLAMRSTSLLGTQYKGNDEWWALVKDVRTIFVTSTP
ncbi:MAG: hypothetical protein PHU71_01140 [Candidatus Gracilibacteria bacterium]|nr:hypothetical protein [Candidatus Gracilibacteria bacterium]